MAIDTRSKNRDQSWTPARVETRRHTTMVKGAHASLVCGVVAGPLFIGVALIEGVTRQGFDLVRLPLSLLSVGDGGLVQVANFIVTGLLVVMCALGMWRVLHPGPGGTWGPRLVGVFGLGLIAAGVFSPDPAFGFPPGTAQGVPSGAQSWHSQLHGIAFDVAFLALIVNCFVFVRRFAILRQRGWAAYCAATGVVLPTLIVLGFANMAIIGLLFLAAGAIAVAWLASIAANLMSSDTGGQ